MDGATRQGDPASCASGPPPPVGGTIIATAGGDESARPVGDGDGGLAVLDDREAGAVGSTRTTSMTRGGRLTIIGPPSSVSAVARPRWPPTTTRIAAALSFRSRLNGQLEGDMA